MNSRHAARPRLLAGCLLLLAASASAEVYRCGADGRSFSDRPCPVGQAGDRLAPARGPDAAAVDEAQAVARREREALRRLAQERRQRWAEAAPSAGGIAVQRPAPAESALPRKKPFKASARPLTR
jgi:hypothetical protein